MGLERLDDVTALLKARVDAEAGAGFPRLSLVPSSSTVRFLDYFASLSVSDRAALLDSKARADALLFYPPAVAQGPLMALLDADPALLRYRAAMLSAPFTMGLRYESLRMARAMLGDAESVAMMTRTRATLDFTPRDDLPAALVPDPDRSHVQPARTPLLRPVINRALGELFAVQKRKLAGGETGYSGVLEDTPITVWIDFAARDLQLRYGVTIPDEDRTVLVFRFAYEDLWAGGPGWDYLTEQNAESSIRLLCELVTEVVRLRNAIRAVW